MKKKLALEQLIEWADEYYEIHKSSPSLASLKQKARELLSVEKEEIASAYSMGAIDEDMHMEGAQPNFTGAYDYIEKTFEQ